MLYTYRILINVTLDPGLGAWGIANFITLFAHIRKHSGNVNNEMSLVSGICYLDCANDSVSVPYGTNLPGQTICYRTQRQVLESFTEVQSCAAQLPQTAHHALQLPYTIFGLGLAPNFLDFVYVNVTNTSAVSQSKIWPQVNPPPLSFLELERERRDVPFFCP